MSQDEISYCSPAYLSHKITEQFWINAKGLRSKKKSAFDYAVDRFNHATDRRLRYSPLFNRHD